MRSVRLVVSVLILLGYALPSAADDEAYARSGPYIGGGATWITDLFQDEVERYASDLAGAPVAVEIDETWGLNGVAGYRLFPILAIEAQYEFVDEFSIGISGGGAAGAVDLSGHVLTGNLKLILPTGRIQPYVLAGAGVVWYEASGGVSGLGPVVFEDDRSFAGRVGAGVDLYLTQHLLLDVGATAVLSTEKVSSNVSGADLKGIHYVAAGASLELRF